MPRGPACAHGRVEGIGLLHSLGAHEGATFGGEIRGCLHLGFANTYNNTYNFSDPSGEFSLPILLTVATILFIYVSTAASTFVLYVNYQANKASRDARDLNLQQDPNMIEGPTDAIRHCTSSCRFTRMYGSDAASLIVLSPELSRPGHAPGPRSIDFHNNCVGRRLAEEGGAECLMKCLDALDRGELAMQYPDGFPNAQLGPLRDLEEGVPDGRADAAKCHD
ncbi:MAG: hypothetical protein OXU20_13220 [Myxococcales bacterium]|nr:hypothetical protein [Myxococcales bacterium]